MTGLAELEKEKYKSLGIEKKNDNKNRHISDSVRRPVKMHFNIKKTWGPSRVQSVQNERVGTFLVSCH